MSPSVIMRISRFTVKEIFCPRQDLIWTRCYISGGHWLWPTFPCCSSLDDLLRRHFVPSQTWLWSHGNQTAADRVMMSGGKTLNLWCSPGTCCICLSGVLLNLYHGLDLKFEIFNNGVEYLAECHFILNIYYCQCYQWTCCFVMKGADGKVLLICVKCLKMHPVFMNRVLPPSDWVYLNSLVEMMRKQVFVQDSLFLWFDSVAV